MPELYRPLHLIGSTHVATCTQALLPRSPTKGSRDERILASFRTAERFSEISYEGSRDERILASFRTAERHQHPFL